MSSSEINPKDCKPGEVYRATCNGYSAVAIRDFPKNNLPWVMYRRDLVDGRCWRSDADVTDLVRLVPETEESELADAKARIAKLEKEFSDAIAVSAGQYDGMRAQGDNLRQQVKDAGKYITELVEEREELKKKVADLEAGNGNLINSLRQAVRDRNELHEIVTELKAASNTSDLDLPAVRRDLEEDWVDRDGCTPNPLAGINAGTTAKEWREAAAFCLAVAKKVDAEDEAQIEADAEVLWDETRHPTWVAWDQASSDSKKTYRDAIRSGKVTVNRDV